MSSFPLRLGLWSSLIVVAVAVYLRLQQPLQDIFHSDEPSRTFCFTKGVTAKCSTSAEATCFTVKDGVFIDVFTPKSDPHPEAHVHDGHAIPGLWDGVSTITSTKINSNELEDADHLEFISTDISSSTANFCTL